MQICKYIQIYQYKMLLSMYYYTLGSRRFPQLECNSIQCVDRVTEQFKEGKDLLQLLPFGFARGERGKWYFPAATLSQLPQRMAQVDYQLTAIHWQIFDWLLSSKAYLGVRLVRRGSLTLSRRRKQATEGEISL